jgi:hypothetical protein
MHRLLDHFRTNLVAYLALFVALGGTSYAAVTLPANSVGTRQLKNNSITPIKFKTSDIAGYVAYWASVGPGGQIVSSRPKGARLVSWDPTYDTGLLRWPTLSKACVALSTGDDGFVRATVLPGPGTHATVQFETYNPAGQPASQHAVIAVLCPVP